MKNNVTRLPVGPDIGFESRRRTVREFRLRVIAELTAIIGICVLLIAAVDGFGS